jgi:hypothetical protein
MNRENTGRIVELYVRTKHEFKKYSFEINIHHYKFKRASKYFGFRLKYFPVNVRFNCKLFLKMTKVLILLLNKIFKYEYSKN